MHVVSQLSMLYHSCQCSITAVNARVGAEGKCILLLTCPSLGGMVIAGAYLCPLVRQIVRPECPQSLNLDFSPPGSCWLLTAQLIWVSIDQRGVKFNQTRLSVVDLKIRELADVFNNIGPNFLTKPNPASSLGSFVTWRPIRN